MRRTAAALACLATLFLAHAVLQLHAAPAEPPGTGGTLSWIWAPGMDTGTACFRKTFEIPRPFAKPTDEAVLHITADNEYKVWFNGKLVGSGNNWKKVQRYDVNDLTVPGKNVIAVEVNNTDGPGGLLVRLGFIPNGMSKLAVVSNGQWKCNKTKAEGWEKPEFKDSSWQAANDLGAYGQAEPWKTVAWEGGGEDRFKVPQGFVVETVVPAKPKAEGLDPKLPFSLINMCFDAKGRLLVSQERGPIVLCTDLGKDGQFQKIRPYCTQVKGCQGMCWVDDALLLMGDGPKGTGLYRCKDTNGDDQTDTAELLVAFKGGMGEHGPHAIIHGPDDHLYVIVGNHAWAKIDKLAANSPHTRWPDGQMGPDQGKPNSTEDYLLPRLNDARGHAANILAPGGTVWRFDKNGKEAALVSAGFRNAYDGCFNVMGEFFVYDSDMEWDEGLPWYRAPRVCMAFPGSDFLWRTGSANTPDYYIDSLPPVAETGRGSPVGVECYEHTAFPEQYRNTVFLADWSAGKIFALRQSRGGFGSVNASMNVEEFCSGTPMNVTDLATGPDGALYFTCGGRGTEGGVFRIVAKGPGGMSARSLMGMMRGGGKTKADEALQVPQPWSAWGRARIAALRKEAGSEWGPRLEAIAADKSTQFFSRMRALDFLQNYGPPPSVELLSALAYNETEDDVPFMAAQATVLLGLANSPAAKKPLVEAMHDGLQMVRRRACEGLLRGGHEPPLDDLWILLADQQRNIRAAARQVLMRIPAEKWVPRIEKERSDYIAMEAIVALCKSNQAAKYSPVIASRLGRIVPSDDPEFQLDYLRVWQLVLLHANQGEVAAPAKEMLERLARQFPPTAEPQGREMAILLTHGKRAGLLEEPIHAKLLDAMLREKNQKQAIHYFLCLRLLHDGWTPAQKKQLLAWYEGTNNWRGGFSFTPFLEAIYRDCSPIFAKNDAAWLLESATTHPFAVAALLRVHRDKGIATPPEMLAAYEKVLLGGQPHPDLKAAFILALSRHLPDEAAQAALRKVGDIDLGQRDNVARALANVANDKNRPYLVRGLESTSPVVCLSCLKALKEIPVKPALDDPRPYRAVLTAASRVDLNDRKAAVLLLRQWTGKRFVPDDGDWKDELKSWAQWFAQVFPNEPPLPQAASLTSPSKWKSEEILNYLEHGQKGRTVDLARGKALFTKANCYKCHKFGSEGETIGPDLTTIKSKFKRDYLVEAILQPSKVVSDQYRGCVIQTKNGKLVTGLAAPQGDVVVVLQADGTKLTLKNSEVESQVAATTSPMPERLLDEMTLEEIADLFAFLESNPK